MDDYFQECADITPTISLFQVILWQQTVALHNPSTARCFPLLRGSFFSPHCCPFIVIPCITFDSLSYKVKSKSNIIAHKK